MINFENSKYFEAYNQITDIVGKQQPEIAVILGSGLGHFADSIKDKIVLPTKNINLFPKSTVLGHNGNMVFGHVNGKQVLTYQGRIHFYEGYSIEDVVFPVIISHLFGVKKIIITNVSGAVNLTFHPGNIIFIDNHITNPNIEKEIFDLFGMKNNFRKEIYDAKILREISNITDKLGIEFRKGTYFWTTGPSYETPAEIRAMRTIGADMVGMSTVPEVIAAASLDMKIICLSCISNYASGILDEPLTHNAVIDVIEKNNVKISSLLSEIIKLLGTSKN